MKVIQLGGKLMVKMLVDIKSVEEAKKFVETVRKYDYSVDVLSQQYVIDGKSILGLLSLDLSKPLEVYIRNDNCQSLVEELAIFAHNLLNEI